MILTFTDFGHNGPYLGQIEVVLHRLAPNVPVVHLMADAPRFRPVGGGYLLAALTADVPAGAVFLGGVGDASDGVIMHSGGSWFVGPDNGLFDAVAARTPDSKWWTIEWRPGYESVGFQGRDIFAPVAAWLSLGMNPEAAGGVPATRDTGHCSTGLAEIIYIDGFGNAATGIRGSELNADATVTVAGRVLFKAQSYQSAGAGELFWYINSDGLAEIAAGGASAAKMLGLGIGDAIAVGAA